MTPAKSEPPPPDAPLHVAVLARSRGQQVLNAVDQQLKEAPLRALAFLVLLVVIWTGLSGLLAMVLRQIGRWELVAVVAKDYIFIHFFLVLAVMLAFSNAILAFGSLFGRQEAGFVLSLPVRLREALFIKWLEGLVLSSWSFLLLGVPLMIAVATTTDVQWYYYPLFAGHFLGFVLIPATFGLLVAWAVAMWAPRRPRTVAIWVGGAIVVALGVWVWSILRNADAADAWLKAFYSQLRLVRQPYLPSNWSALGIVAAIQRNAEASLFYLGAVVANGAFFAWLAINLLSRYWPEAFSRASHGRPTSVVRTGWLTQAVTLLLFFYLPRKLRVLMLKDVRSFIRDPAQWTQMVIMIGLLVVYAANLRSFPMNYDQPGMRAVMAFLNLTTVSLILATFTSRFVFPCVSLETQQLWLIGLLPMRRLAFLLNKFLFSVTITGLSALLVMGLAMRALELPADWTLLQLSVALGICVGLSGLSVGLGARFPMLGQRNPARIASGFGGTMNLVFSMLFVAGQMALLALVSASGFNDLLSGVDELRLATWLIPAMFLLGVAVAGLGLLIGAKHFERLEV
ncbi:MAG: hypothetical protein IPM13_08845 [Phycisphaerales bacterium]|nr:hypothetical protein [Phycisphaerales bacterium]